MCGSAIKTERERENTSGSRNNFQSIETLIYPFTSIQRVCDTIKCAVIPLRLLSVWFFGLCFSIFVLYLCCSLMPRPALFQTECGTTARFFFRWFLFGFDFVWSLYKVNERLVKKTKRDEMRKVQPEFFYDIGVIKTILIVNCE